MKYFVDQNCLTSIGVWAGAETLVTGTSAHLGNSRADDGEESDRRETHIELLRVSFET